MSEKERAREGKKQEEKGGRGRDRRTDGRTEGRRDFIRAKRPCGCCGEQAWQVI